MTRRVGMIHTTDIRPHLAERGIDLSPVQVYRLVAQTPERLNLTVLAALCDILGCTAADLFEPTVEIGSGRARKAAAAGGETPDLRVYVMRLIRQLARRAGIPDLTNSARTRCGTPRSPRSSPPPGTCCRRRSSPATPTRAPPRGRSCHRHAARHRRAEPDEPPSSAPTTSTPPNGCV
jgi:hypothetical protein